jgi:hypothetical protein
MTQPTTPQPGLPATPPAVCARCDKPLVGDDRVDTGDRTFCRTCYDILRMQLQQGIEGMSRDVNYPMAVLGALLGGTAGVLLWWGFTVFSKISFGLVAVAIGFLVAHGAMRFAGQKRSRGIQAVAIAVAVLSFLVATYLVNATFINQELARRNETWRVPYVPASVQGFSLVVYSGFDFMDLVFLAIVVWEAWSIPRPLQLDPTS